MNFDHYKTFADIMACIIFACMAWVVLGMVWQGMRNAWMYYKRHSRLNDELDSWMIFEDRK